MSDAETRAALLRVVVERPGPVVPDATTWVRWSSVATSEHVIPLLYQLVDHVPTDLSDDDREVIHVIQVRVQSHFVRLEHHLLLVAGLLAQRGIRAAVLKGGATAHLDYPDPSWRQVTDIDLLIDPADLAAAIALLLHEGWVQAYALPPRHRQFTHAVTLVHEGMELDLHQRVAHRALGVLVPTKELLDRGVSFDIAGSELLALDEIDRLIHATIHAVTSRGIYRRLSTVADVLLAADRRRHLAGDVLARAERWRVRSLVERGVLDAYAAAQLDVPDAWLDAMCTPQHRRDALVDRAYLGSARRPVVEELAYLRLMPGWRNRWEYVRGYFTTDPEYAAQHGRSGVRAQARYVVGKLRSQPR